MGTALNGSSDSDCDFDVGRLSDEEQAHLDKVILRNAQHDQCEDSLDPDHPGSGPWQTGERAAEKSHQHEQGAHAKRKYEQVDESEHATLRRRDPSEYCR